MLSSGAKERLARLDAELDATHATPEVAEQLFSVVDALDSSSGLRRALSDFSAPGQARADLANRLFGQRVGPDVLRVVQAASAQHWTNATDLSDALEREAVRGEFRLAQAGGGLEAVNEELFRFSRTVAGEPQLRDAIENRAAPLELRERLVDQLLADKAGQGTVRLARRALRARQRTVGLTIEHYVQLGAELANRSIARVTAAQPLDEGQAARLRAALTRIAGRAVELQVAVDPRVLGGLRVQIGDQVIEGTVAGRLEDARRQIA